MRQVARYCGKVNYRSGCRNYFRKVIYSVREPGPSIRLLVPTVGIREPGISVTYIFKKVQPARQAATDYRTVEETSMYPPQ